MDTLLYLNGEMIPESEARISIFDIGFMYSAVFYESFRTFKHEVYKLDEHLERLDRSIRNVGLQPLVSREKLKSIVERTIQSNIHLFDEDDDLWMNLQVTPGQGFPHPLTKGVGGGEPTIIAYVSPMPYDTYSRYYTEGKPAYISTVRNVPPAVLDSRGKTRFRLHYFKAKLEAAAADPDAFALLLDIDGFVTEGTGANVFIVSNGVLQTPTTRNILEGISRRTVIQLAQQIGIPVEEKDITTFDLYNADEAFWTTSTYCILPIPRFNHVSVRCPIPGPVTKKLLETWSAEVGLDIVGQAMKYSSRSTDV